MNDLGAVAEPVVYVMRPSDPTSPVRAWSWGSLIRHDGLILESDTRTLSSAGTASFRLLRRSRNRERGKYSSSDPEVLRGQWVVVATNYDRNSGRVDPASVLWWGSIESIEERPVHPDGLSQDSSGNLVEEVRGSVTAVEIGEVWDSYRIEVFPLLDGNGNLREIEPTGTFNVSRDGGLIAGNAKATGDYYAIASELSDIGTGAGNLWSRWRLLRALVNYMMPDYAPTTEVLGSDGNGGANPSTTTWISTALNSTEDPEVFDLSKATIRRALDTILPRSQGLGWHVVLVDGGGTDITWRIVVSVLTDLSSDLPAPTSVDVDLNASRVHGEPVYDSGTYYDRVRVLGAPILHGITVCNEDGNWVNWWSSAAQTAYDAADAKDRGLPEYEDVYQAYRLDFSTTDAGNRQTQAPGGGSQVALIPRIDWDGSTASVINSDDTYSSLASLRCARIIPWPAGLDASGTDEAADGRSELPEYLPPQVFWKNSSDDWICLTRPGENQSDVLQPQISPLDRGPGLRMRWTPPLAVALASTTLGDDENVGSKYPWDELVVTLGVWSTQRLEIEKTKTGLTASQAVRTLTVEDNSLACWVCHAGTVLGVSSDALQRTSTARFVRNDWAAAERLANRMAAWAFAERSSMDVQLARPDALPSWTTLGTFIGDASESLSSSESNPPSVSRAVNSAVTVINRTWQGNPLARISTEVPPIPERIGGTLSVAPSSGAGGGGGRAEMAQVHSEIKDLQQQQQRTPVFTPGQVRTPFVVLIVGDGNQITSSPSIDGLKAISDLVSGNGISQVPDAAPSLGASYVTDGLTPATREDTGEVVWLASKITLSGTDYIDGGSNSSGIALPEGTYVICRKSVSVPKVTSGSATVWLPWQI